MSSWKVSKRAHKERHQPAHRAKLGLLEKKKDYKLRAKDFHRKQDTLRKLREEASFRNPDEFYFAMVHARVEKGVHIVQRSSSTSWSVQQMKQMTDEDLGYLVNKVQSGLKELDRLQAELLPLVQATTPETTSPAAARAAAASAAVAPPSKRVVFCYSDDEEDAASAASRTEAMLAESAKRTREAVMPRDVDRRRRLHRAEVLADRRTRLERLQKLIETLAVKKSLYRKGPRRKLVTTVDQFGDEAKGVRAIYQWASQRKK